MRAEDSDPPPDEPRWSAPDSQQEMPLGRVSLVLGVSSLPLLFVLGLGLPIAIAAVVLGLVGRRKASSGRADSAGEALAGLLCGAATLALAVILIARPDS